MASALVTLMECGSLLTMEPKSWVVSIGRCQLSSGWRRPPLIMKLLVAMNFCLRGAGLDPISDPSTENSIAGLAKEVIERTRREILETGFRFNTRTITLQVDDSGRVGIAKSLLRVNLPRGLTERADTENGGHFVWDISNDEWFASTLERIDVINDIEDLDNMPEGFGRWIARQSAVNFFTEQMGSKVNVPQTLLDQRNEARAKAENSLPEESIFTATKWAQRRNIQRRGRSTSQTRFF